MERQIGLTTLRELQSAAVGIVAQSHMEIVVVFAERHCTLFVTCNAEIAAAVFAHLGRNRGCTATMFLAFAAPHTAALVGSHSPPSLVEYPHWELLTPRLVCALLSAAIA